MASPDLDILIFSQEQLTLEDHGYKYNALQGVPLQLSLVISVAIHNRQG